MIMERGTGSYVAELNLPNIDGYVLPHDAYTSLATRASTSKIDLLVGIDAQDAATFVDRDVNVNTYTANVRKSYGPLADQLLARFPARSAAEASSASARLNTLDVAWRTFGWARIHAQHGAGRTYGFVFSRVPPWPPFATLHAAGHGAELPYVFGFPPRSAFFASTWPWRALRDADLATQIQGYFTNFAKTGDPNGAGLPRWSEFGAEESVLNFSDSTYMEALPERVEFPLLDAQWDKQ